MKKIFLLAAICCSILASCNKQESNLPGVVSHRGFWDTEGSAQNSIFAIQKAGEIGSYGAEFDVNMTADGILVVNHDFTYHGYEIYETPFDTLRQFKLSNGEQLPTLDEYLEASLAYPDMKLVFELKSRGGQEYEAKAIPASIEAIKKYGVEKRVEFISFSLSACKEFARLMPENMVEYLGGEQDPADLKAAGINGIDYHYSAILKHPDWVKKAHDLGMICNIWTISTEPRIKWALNMGADMVTTNNPLLAKKLIAEFKANGPFPEEETVVVDD